MKITYTAIGAVTLFSALLTGCGGNDSNSAVVSQTPTTPAPGVSPTTQTDYSRQEALAALSASALSKGRTDYLDRLLDQSVNQFFVDFTVVEPLPATLESRQLLYSEMKARAAAEIGASNYQIIRDYTVVPQTFIQVNSRRSLVTVLNSPSIRAISENVTYPVPGTGPLYPVPGTPSPAAQ
ncbi:hypothetical protein ACFQUU_22915 [Herbaspirillum sp. GCM10030257]|uniref:hypothetical protein n=1 Tax=Herbaspirillum sp. GCM10030257 TaxID=3273393 RepID=UPI003609F124